MTESEKTINNNAAVDGIEHCLESEFAKYIIQYYFYLIQ